MGSAQASRAQLPDAFSCSPPPPSAPATACPPTPTFVAEEIWGSGEPCAQWGPVGLEAILSLLPHPHYSPTWLNLVFLLNVTLK